MLTGVTCISYWEALRGEDIPAPRIVFLRVNDVPEPFVDLDPEERTRAERFASPALAQAFAARRSALRRVLGAVLGEAPSALKFATTGTGKPVLANHPNLHFNLSHNRDSIVIALSRAAPVGMDIEHLRPVPEYRAISADWVPAPRDETAFLAGWTAREAVLKAHARGITEIGNLNDLKVPEEGSGLCRRETALGPVVLTTGLLEPGLICTFCSSAADHPAPEGGKATP